jgi:hypothetical protein
VTLCVFYFYKIIGKLTVFFQFQEFRNFLDKDEELRIFLNIDGANLSFINFVSIFRFSSPSHRPVYERDM